eukprot:1061672-Prymnesium_polylepis.2
MSARSTSVALAASGRPARRVRAGAAGAAPASTDRAPPAGKAVLTRRPPRTRDTSLSLCTRSRSAPCVLCIPAGEGAALHCA